MQYIWEKKWIKSRATSKKKTSPWKWSYAANLLSKYIEIFWVICRCVWGGLERKSNILQLAHFIFTFLTCRIKRNKEWRKSPKFSKCWSQCVSSQNDTQGKAKSFHRLVLAVRVNISDSVCLCLSPGGGSDTTNTAATMFSLRVDIGVYGHFQQGPVNCVWHRPHPAFDCWVHMEAQLCICRENISTCTLI